MSDVYPTISIVTLNVNGLNNPVKRQCLAVYMLSVGDSFQIQRYKYIQSKKMERDITCKQQPCEIYIDIIQIGYIDIR